MMDRTILNHDNYVPRYSRSFREELRTAEPSVGQFGAMYERHEINAPPPIMDRGTYGSRHLVHHLTGTPEDAHVDETSVDIARQALSETFTNPITSFYEIQSRQPHILTYMFDINPQLSRSVFGEYVSPDDRYNRNERIRGESAIGGLLVADRLTRLWVDPSVGCRLADCLHNRSEANETREVPILPLNYILATDYDARLSSSGGIMTRPETLVSSYARHWFSRLVGSYALEATTREELESYFARQVVIQAVFYGDLLADGYTMTNPDIVRIEPDDPMPPATNAEGSD